MDERSIQHSVSDNARWLVLVVACLGVLMATLDGTIVNVALPSIGASLGLSESSLVWVINGYLIPFGGFLLLCGRLGDHYGHRRIYVFGIALFTVASLGCGVAGTLEVLVVARVLQGVGAAATWAVAFSLIMEEFDGTLERARALAISSGVLASSSSAGALLGGILTNKFGWRWIFLVNLPIGVAVCAVCGAMGFHTARGRRDARLDVAGAVMITLSLTLAIFSVLDAAKAGWRTPYTIIPICGALAFSALFVVIESRVRAPIVPLDLFRHHNLRVSVFGGALWGAAQYLWFFITPLYLQLILGYDALNVGLAFLPATFLMTALSLGLSTRLVTRFGPKRPFTIGVVFVALGLIFLSRVPVRADFVLDILPGMLLLGLGCGISHGPFLLIALSEVSKEDYGVASGVVNSAVVMGQSLALALIVSLAAARTDRLLAAGANLPVALDSGYRFAFCLSAAFAFVAALLFALRLHSVPDR